MCTEPSLDKMSGLSGTAVEQHFKLLAFAPEPLIDRQLLPICLHRLLSLLSAVVRRRSCLAFYGSVPRIDSSRAINSFDWPLAVAHTKRRK